VRVVTFNIHHGTVGKDGPVDPERLAEVCAGFDADVLALQEVDLGTYRTGGADLAGTVARRCDMDHVFGPTRRFPGGWYGNALLVRGDLCAWSVLALPRVPRWKLWQEPRSVIAATVRTAGIRLSVMVTHLAVPQDVNGPQLDHLLARVGNVGSDHLVVAGDLNRRPAGVQPQAEAAGLTFVPHGHTNPVVPRPKRPIDHVLLSPALRPVAVEVRPTEMSDHCALIVDVEAA
jgi:endonuclease/exonuclease/phosphatase family metal-dependent hydrolase